MYLRLLLLTLVAVSVLSDNLFTHTSTLTEGVLKQTVVFEGEGNVYVCDGRSMVRLWKGTEVARAVVHHPIAIVITREVIVLFQRQNFVQIGKNNLSFVNEVRSSKTKESEITVLQNSFTIGRSGGNIVNQTLLEPSNIKNSNINRAIISMAYPSETSSGGHLDCAVGFLPNAIYDGKFITSFSKGLLTIYNVTSTCEISEIATDAVNINSATVLGMTLGTKHQIVLLLRHHSKGNTRYLVSFINTENYPEQRLTSVVFLLSDKFYEMGLLGLESRRDLLEKKLKNLRFSYSTDRQTVTVVGRGYAQVWELFIKKRENWEHDFSQYLFFEVDQPATNRTLSKWSEIGHETLRVTLGDGVMLSRLFILAEKTCTKSSFKSYPKSVHPLQLSYLGSQSVGLLLFSVCVVSSICLLLFIVEVGFHRFDIDIPLKAPSSVLLVLQSQYQLLSLSSTMILLYPLEGGWGFFEVYEQLIAPSSLFVLISCLGIPYYIHGTIKAGVVHNKKAVFTYEDPIVFHERGILVRILIGPGEWTPLFNSERNWVEKHASILTLYNQEGIWLCNIELIVTLLVSVLNSWKADSDVGCGMLKLASCSLMISLTIIQVVYKPFSRPRNNIYYPLISMSQAIALICRSVSLFIGDIDHVINDVGSFIFEFSGAIISAKVVLDILAVGIIFKTKRSQKVTKQAWLQLQKSTSTDVV